MNSPVVSVVIPCYNQAQYLKECLDSVMAQTFQDFEIIVVDDGSTQKDSDKIFQKLKYPKTTIIHQKNKGVVAARNAGILVAKGKYILPLDADDKIAPIVLEKSVSILQKKPEVGIVGGQTECFGAKTGPFDIPAYSFPEILVKNSLVVSCMFRRSDWEKVGGYNSNMVFGLEDYDFWLSLIERGRKVYQFKDVFLFYRQHTHSRITALQKQKDRRNKMICQLVENHPKLYEKHSSCKRILLNSACPHRQISFCFLGIPFFKKIAP